MISIIAGVFEWSQKIFSHLKFLVSSTASSIVGTIPPSVSGFVNAGGTGALEEFVINGIDVALAFSAIVGLGAIIYAGFLYITAAGDTNKVATANRTIVYTVIGIVVAFGAVLVVSWLIDTIF